MTKTTEGGFAASQVIEQLQKPLANGAYKKHPTKGYLTTIDSSFSRERLTEVFGLYGVGWGLTWDTEHTKIWTTETKGGKEWWHFALLQANFWFVYGDEIIEFPVTGYGNNDNLGDAMEGAQTNAVNLAAKRMLFQLHIYKDEAPPKIKTGKQPEIPEQSTNGQRKKFSRPMPLDELQEYAQKEQFTKFTSTPTEKDFKQTMASLNKLGFSDDRRHQFGLFMFGKASSKDWTSGECAFINKWAGCTKENDWQPIEDAMKEAQLFIEFMEENQGIEENWLEDAMQEFEQEALS